MEYITSRNNEAIIAAAKLRDKKYRDSQGVFICEGIKLFGELLNAGISPLTVFATENNASLLKSLGESVRCCIVSEGVYEKISCEKSPQGIFCIVKSLDNLHKFDTIYSGIENSSVFCLSSVRDPGNLGTIMRTALTFGIDTLILSDDCADIYNPKTIRSAMGAAFRLNTLRTPDLAKTVEALAERGYETYAAALDSEAVTPGDIVFSRKTCFVAGNEGHGIDKSIIEKCQKTIYIPMKDGCESLNVASACTVLMWELSKTLL